MMRSPATIPTIALCLVLSFGLSSCRTKDFDAELRNAEAKVGQGDNDGALAAYRAIAGRYPDDPRRAVVLLRIAGLYATVFGDDDLAIKAYGRVIDEYPLSEAAALAREGRAGLYEKRDEHDLAIEDYSALIKFFPDHPDRHLFMVLRAGEYLAQRNFPQARLEVRPLLEEKGVPPAVCEQALFAAGESYFLEDQPARAVPFYQQMLKEFPNSKLASEAELHLATCVEEMGYLGTARDMTKEAERDYPNRKVIDARLKSIKERGSKPVQTPGTPLKAPKK